LGKIIWQSVVKSTLYWFFQNKGFVNMKKLMMNRGSFDIVLYCIYWILYKFMYLISTLFIILQFVSLLLQTVKDFLMVVLEGQWSLASDRQGKKIIFIATKGITGLLYTHNILTGDCNVWIAVPRKLLFQFFSIYKECCCLWCKDQVLFFNRLLYKLKKQQNLIKYLNYHGYSIWSGQYFLCCKTTL